MLSKITVIILSSLLLSFASTAQTDTIPVEELPVNTDLLEDYIQGNDDDVPFEFNTIFEELESYAQNPLDLNEANAEELESLKLLSDIQINALIQYRQKLGNFIAIYELQAVPGFDLETINQILPYVNVRQGLEDYNISIGEMMKEGRNELFVRWARIIEEQKGYLPTDGGEGAPAFRGDPNKVYLRYRHSYSNKLSFGLTAEKDAGEEFFKGSNKQGFDYYSAHFYLRDYRRWLKSLAIGDYTISMGQGLILYTGFGRGKSAQVMNIKRTRRAVRGYTSVDENNFMRGAAATFKFGEHFQLTTFGSYKSRDGNLQQEDSGDLEIQQFTSLQLSGLHRTENELEDKNALNLTEIGGILKYKRSNGHIAFNGLYSKFDKTLQRAIRPYNRFYFNGDRLSNFSLDYSYIFRNYNFFGETARSDNGALATVNGLLMSLDRNVDFSLLHRHFDIDYQAINPNPFAESSGARNENGLYLGLEIRPIKHWRLSAYYDIYRHPWLRFTADAPSKGHEYRVRLTYFRKRKMEAYIQVRDERKEINAAGNTTPVDFLVNSRLFQTRFHFSNKLSRAIELRSRLDLGFYNDGTDAATQKGIVVYQDVIYRPIGSPFSLSGRFAIFDTDGYGVRYYSFENDLLYSVSIPAYYNRGSRFYVNLRYKGIRNVSLELRYAQTYWANQETFGSGQEEIQGQTRSEVKAQVSVRW